MKRNWPTALILTLFIAFSSVACDSPPQNVSTNASEDAGGNVRGKNYVWPPVDKNGSNVKASLEDNLLKKNYYIVVDFSGSMSYDACNGKGSRADVVKQAVPKFVESIPVDANLGLAMFVGGEVKEYVPLGSGSGNREATKQAISSTRPDGGTPLSTAVEFGYKKLTEQARRQLGYGEYHLVMVTDGEANIGYDPTKAVNMVLSDSPVSVQTIGFCIGSKHSLNQPGRTVYKEAGNLEEMNKGLAEVLAESTSYQDIKDFKK